MCQPSPPGAKKAQAAAEAQGQANVDAAVATGQINNPNVINPYGTQTVTWNGNQPTITQEFSPEQQKLFNQSMTVKDLLGQLGIQGATSLKDILGKSFDFSGAPAAPGSYGKTRETVLNAMLSRYDQDANQRRDAAQADLVARGLRPGTEAFDREMTRMDQQRNDYMLQSETAAGAEVQRAHAMDEANRRNYIAELISQRQLPLNEIIGLMSGSQVQNPFQIGGYNAGANVAPAPMTLPFQAQMNQYNADAADYGNMMSGLFGLGSAGVTGYFS